MQAGPGLPRAPGSGTGLARVQHERIVRPAQAANAACRGAAPFPGTASQSPNLLPRAVVNGEVMKPLAQPMEAGPNWAVMKPLALEPPQRPGAPLQARPPMPMPTSYESAARAAAVYDPQTEQLLRVLRESVLASERHAVVEQLSRYDWRSQPNVAAALMTAAINDSAPAVRASCVHALALMKVKTREAVQTVEALKNDSDLRVRQEVLLALAVLTPGG